jgi:uncharacterized protein YbcC (UPF0753/DUF2309 family)
VKIMPLLQDSRGRQATLQPRVPSLRPVAADESLAQAVSRTAGLVSPVWPLADYVAVNPFLGLVDRDWLAAREFLRSVSACETLPTLAHFRSRWRAGAFAPADIDAAIDELMRDGVAAAGRLDTAAIVDLLEATAEPDLEPADDPARLRTLAEIVERCGGADWSAVVHEEIGKHLAAFYDEGIAPWKNGRSERPLYTAWQEAAAVDRRLELLGVTGFRRLVAGLPSKPLEALATLLAHLRVPLSLRERLLAATALSVPGWAAWTRYQELAAERRGEICDDFTALVAIRLAYDTAIAEAHDTRVDWQAGGLMAPASAGVPRSVLVRSCLLRAGETAKRRRLLGSLAAGKRASVPRADLAHLVFCIDVRSERMRRAVEGQDAGLRTAGFAGFFGVPMELVPWGELAGSSHAPAPLAPSLRVHDGPAGHHAAATSLGRRVERRGWRTAWQGFKKSATASFAFVETCGLAWGLDLVRRSLGVTSWAVDPRFDGVAAADREAFGPLIDDRPLTGAYGDRLIELAAGIVRGLHLPDLDTPLVVLCGHASRTVNNPLKAALDCGACCGHSGEANGRVAARLLNLPAIRLALAARGLPVPEGLHFLAAVHDTTTDEITLCDRAAVPATHAGVVADLERRLAMAAGEVRRERLPTLGGGNEADLVRRSRDWSELQPEWGLAGNWAIVIGPRTLSAAADLEGGVFLHEYDAARDADGSALEGIMTAPLVVSHWINMQYYASTVDNRRYGAGTKAIHSVVGGFGLAAGGGGDLLTGLPLQSLADGGGWRHEPLRLQAVIAAPRERIAAIAGKHTLLEQLVTNDWLAIIAVEEGRFFRLTRRLAWQPLHVPGPGA